MDELERFSGVLDAIDMLRAQFEQVEALIDQVTPTALVALLEEHLGFINVWYGNVTHYAGQAQDVLDTVQGLVGRGTGLVHVGVAKAQEVAATVTLITGSIRRAQALLSDVDNAVAGDLTALNDGVVSSLDQALGDQVAAAAAPFAGVALKLDGAAAVVSSFLDQLDIASLEDFAGDPFGALASASSGAFKRLLAEALVPVFETLRAATAPLVGTGAQLDLPEGLGPRALLEGLLAGPLSPSALLDAADLALAGVSSAVEDVVAEVAAFVTTFFDSALSAMSLKGAATKAQALALASVAALSPQTPGAAAAGAAGSTLLAAAAPPGAATNATDSLPGATAALGNAVQDGVVQGSAAVAGMLQSATDSLQAEVAAALDGALHGAGAVLEGAMDQSGHAQAVLTSAVEAGLLQAPEREQLADGPWVTAALAQAERAVRAEALPVFAAVLPVGGDAEQLLDALSEELVAGDLTAVLAAAQAVPATLAGSLADASLGLLQGARDLPDQVVAAIASTLAQLPPPAVNSSLAEAVTTVRFALPSAGQAVDAAALTALQGHAQHMHAAALACAAAGPAALNCTASAAAASTVLVALELTSTLTSASSTPLVEKLAALESSFDAVATSWAALLPAVAAAGGQPAEALTSLVAGLANVTVFAGEALPQAAEATNVTTPSLPISEGVAQCMAGLLTEEEAALALQAAAQCAATSARLLQDPADADAAWEAVLPCATVAQLLAVDACDSVRGAVAAHWPVALWPVARSPEGAALLLTLRMLGAARQVAAVGQLVQPVAQAALQLRAVDAPGLALVLAGQVAQPAVTHAIANLTAAGGVLHATAAAVAQDVAALAALDGLAAAAAREPVLAAPGVASPPFASFAMTAAPLQLPTSQAAIQAAAPVPAVGLGATAATRHCSALLQRGAVDLPALAGQLEALLAQADVAAFRPEAAQAVASAAAAAELLLMSPSIPHAAQLADGVAAARAMAATLPPGASLPPAADAVLQCSATLHVPQASALAAQAAQYVGAFEPLLQRAQDVLSAWQSVELSLATARTAAASAPAAITAGGVSSALAPASAALTSVAGLLNATRTLALAAPLQVMSAHGGAAALLAPLPDVAGSALTPAGEPSLDSPAVRALLDARMQAVQTAGDSALAGAALLDAIPPLVAAVGQVVAAAAPAAPSVMLPALVAAVLAQALSDIPAAVSDPVNALPALQLALNDSVIFFSYASGALPAPAQWPELPLAPPLAAVEALRPLLQVRGTVAAGLQLLRQVWELQEAAAQLAGAPDLLPALGEEVLPGTFANRVAALATSVEQLRAEAQLQGSTAPLAAALPSAPVLQNAVSAVRHGTALLVWADDLHDALVGTGSALAGADLLQPGTWRPVVGGLRNASRACGADCEAAVVALPVALRDAATSLQAALRVISSTAAVTSDAAQAAAAMGTAVTDTDLPAVVSVLTGRVLPLAGRVEALGQLPLPAASVVLGAAFTGAVRDAAAGVAALRETLCQQAASVLGVSPEEACGMAADSLPALQRAAEQLLQDVPAALQALPAALGSDARKQQPPRCLPAWAAARGS
ncbi:hypothetical protein BU14_0583s0001 [Porphyra umbilicalis]|uniref:Uncharacterized protein n=1 Tax=Porphyra umbilicalis TaxID=2786 RepID=A0A1X6NRD3_PORUM|nr:hypothetical protein BU14_0583s0001 [Porphyra umbilicalis]|eukprot:OSX71164.1 hypothetical protein BU14_0583s0001 [Porphyra umbilicalis]